MISLEGLDLQGMNYFYFQLKDEVIESEGVKKFPQSQIVMMTDRHIFILSLLPLYCSCP